MSDERTKDQPAPDPTELAQQWAEIGEQSQRIIADFLSRTAEQGSGPTNPDPLGLGRAFMELGARMMADPQQMWEAQAELWSDYAQLWTQTARRMMGEEAEPVATPERGDRRFRDQDWSDNLLFDFIKQSYLLSARWTQAQVRDVEGLDPHTQQKIDFYTRQYLDAVAPSNFVTTNPKVLKETMESRGENLVRGLRNLLNDLETGGGQLRISQTDMTAFEVGHNIAVTPGKVVFENELMQLIHYEPTTEEVFERPLLIIPPWINKFYILDLQPENSFIRWAVSQGHSVYVISWVNPDERLAEKSFEDYMLKGPLAALDAIERDIGESQANVIGYCLGGTLLASTLAWLKAKDRGPFTSATYFASLVDFSEVGELGVFIDDVQLEAIENMMETKGYLDGGQMAQTFNMLRANDLIWSFVVNNYLLGRDPFPFDLLYWNSDATRMPKAMHTFYLRNMYQRNLLAVPGGLTLAGTPIDLRKIDTPSFVLASREDHIAPWQPVYRGATLYAGPTRFVLAASGHIAGVINPPAAEKYCHWLNTRLPKNPDTWLRNAAEKPGSWWPEWQRWISRFSGAKVPARHPGRNGLAAIEDAPGRYVKM